MSAYVHSAQVIVYCSLNSFSDRPMFWATSSMAYVYGSNYAVGTRLTHNSELKILWSTCRLGCFIRRNLRSFFLKKSPMTKLFYLKLLRKVGVHLKSFLTWRFEIKYNLSELIKCQTNVKKISVSFAISFPTLSSLSQVLSYLWCGLSDWWFVVFRKSINIHNICP